jgi:hypothetical protein
VDTAPTSASIASRLIQITRSIEGIASACAVASRMTKLSSCALRRDLNGVLLVALRALSVMLPARSGGGGGRVLGLFDARKQIREMPSIFENLTFISPRGTFDLFA